MASATYLHKNKQSQSVTLDLLHGLHLASHTDTTYLAQIRNVIRVPMIRIRVQFIRTSRRCYRRMALDRLVPFRETSRFVGEK
jgi:hypothetical protein